MFPHSLTSNIFLFKRNGVSINTENIYVAAEILADLCVSFSIVNGAIVFPIAPEKAPISAGVTIETEIGATPVAAEIAKIEVAPIAPPKPLQIATVLNKPKTPVKTPVFALYGATTTNTTVKELKAFLAQNKPFLTQDKAIWYEAVLNEIIKECKAVKNAKSRATIDDLIDIVDFDVLKTDFRESKCRVSIGRRELKSGMTSLFLQFSETIVHPENGQSVKQIHLGREIFTNPKFKSEKEANSKTLSDMEYTTEKYQNLVNRGEIKIYNNKK